MSVGKKTALGSALLALAIVSGPAVARKHKETPEEKQLYELSLQQEAEAAAKWTAEHPAEAKAQWEETQRSMAANQCRDAAGRNTCAAPPPPTQRMCSVNYGSTVGLAPC
jgi:hypothetical protein